MTAATGVETPRSAAELAALLGRRPGRVRLVGSGSRQARLPVPPEALRIALDGIAAIERLDAADRTCSVDCGVRREVLDAELGARGLELPCPGGGTLGGLFASDPIGAASPGGPCPRSLLLGVEAVLADGTRFRSGARVVKSVAGFDVHKLFVGSAGRLFAATRLHLRMAPAPRAAEWFERRGSDRDEALALLAALGARAVPPDRVQCERTPDGAFVVRGRFAGRASFVAASLREHGLTAGAPTWRDHLQPPTVGEVVAGMVTLGSLPGLLTVLPPGSPFLWHGGGRCEITMPDAAATDMLLAAMTAQRLHGHVVHAAPERRGLGTPIPPAHRRLDDGLRNALDPHGILV